MTEDSSTRVSPASDVFVSYASLDTAVANGIVEALEKHGITCWIAPRDVTPGEFYADAIVGAINASRVLVVVLTHNAVGSTHVLREVERASAKRHPVISLRIDAAPLPTGLEYFLSASHWLDATASGIEAVLPKLADAVRRLVASPSGVDPSQISDAAKRPADLSPQPAAGAKKGRRLSRLLAASMVVIALLAAGLVVERLRVSKPVAPMAVPVATAVPEKSIAVLPFVDMSEKHDQEYFSDGLSEELIDHLSHIPDLKVIARTSSFAFKGKNEDMRSIAAKLGVANLLEGSVRKSGGELRITAQLIRASDGVHLWSEIYDRKLNDIFKVQDEISTTVAKALNIALNESNGAGVQPVSKGTTNIEAYNLLLQGNYFDARSGTGDLARAIGFYHRALTLDPNYGVAWARLALAYSWQGAQGELTVTEAETKGKAAAQRALAIDPNSAEAFFARGNIFRQVLGDWAAAISDFKRAVDLDPRSDAGEYAQGYIFDLKGAMSGRYHEFIDWAHRRLERDPLDSATMFELAEDQQFDGHLDESAATFRKLLELNPAYGAGQTEYGKTLLLMGNNAEALAAVKQETDEAYRLQGLAMVYWTMDRRAESDAALAALERGFADRTQYDIACVHAYRGEKDAAFTWLDRAYQQRRGYLEYLKGEPMLRNLHGDPRFDALLRKVKLVE